MEKYSQFRDKGTAIAPFLPIPPATSHPLLLPLHTTLFFLRLPPLFLLTVTHLLLSTLPVPTTLKKCVLWAILAVPGVWWVDLQVDGVKRGRLGDTQGKGRLPAGGDVVASSFTSPLDVLYLAGIFCPVFVRAWGDEKRVQVISLWGALSMAFAAPQLTPPAGTKLLSLEEVGSTYPDSIVVVFPECTTTNGRGILPLSPCLATVPSQTKIYPVNLRYTPGDITTPVPGGVLAWIWKLLSKPTHQMRVRIAAAVYNEAAATTNGERGRGYETNIWDSPHLRPQKGEGEKVGGVSGAEQKVLDRVGEDLARLGRVKRVGLGVREKAEFVKVWKSRRR